MAHYCPDCAQLCHCNGDIDDITFEGTKEEALCEHCSDEDDEPQEYCIECDEPVSGQNWICSRCQTPQHKPTTETR
jgi:hypothetical protein